MNGGLNKLPIWDVAKIAITPGIGDLFSGDGVKQVVRTAVMLAEDSLENLSNHIFDGLKRQHNAQEMLLLRSR